MGSSCCRDDAATSPRRAGEDEPLCDGSPNEDAPGAGSYPDEVETALRLLRNAGAVITHDGVLILDPGVDSVRRFLEAQGQPCQQAGDRLGFEVGGHRCMCAQQNGIVYFYVGRIAQIPQSRMLEAAVLLHEVHRRFLLGRLQMDDEGDVALQLSTFAGDEALPGETIKWCLGAVAKGIESALPKLALLQDHAPNETFCYMLGMKHARPEWFDISDAACAEFGDFRHGDRVRDPSSGHVATAIGVREGKIWFHPDGCPGAGVFDDDTLRSLKKIGYQEVDPVQ